MPLNMAGAIAAATLTLPLQLPPLILCLLLSVSLASASHTTQQSPHQLAETALFESLARAASTKAFVKKLLTESEFNKGSLKDSHNTADYENIKDCFKLMNQSEYYIKMSIQELKLMGGGHGRKTIMSQDDFWNHMVDLQTMVNAASGYQESCLYGFDLGVVSNNVSSIEAAIRPRVIYVEQMLDNALAFITLFGNDYSASTNFITASCNATMYPRLCLQSLLAANSITLQQSPHRLAKSALAVSLARAESTKAFLKKSTKFEGLKATEYEAIEDCLDRMDDSVDQLSHAIQELDQIGENNWRRKEEGFFCQMSNLQTMVSAAIINGNECADEFKSLDFKTSSRIKATTLKQVTKLVQVAWNVLGLVNQFAIRKN